MKVKILGFQLELAKNISIGEFYQQLESIEEREISIWGKTHVLLTDVVDEYICGVFLTYKANKKSLATQKDENGELVVNKATLKPGEHGTEVSLFCINPITLRGLFYNYSGAASPTGIEKFFRQQHSHVKRYKIQDYKKELTEFGKKNVDRAEKKARAQFDGDFHLKVLVTPSDLNALLPRYKEIERVILRSDCALDDAGMFSPIEPMTKKAHLQIDLHKDSPIKEAKSLIKKVFSPFSNWRKDQTLRIIGRAYSGDALELAVGENQDHFGVMDYDDYVELLPQFRWRKYNECEALERIIKECGRLTEIFGVTGEASWKLLSAKDVKADGESGRVVLEDGAM